MLMRKAAILVVASIVLTGCMAELLTTTAIQGTLQAEGAAAATRQLQYVKGKVGNINIQQSIDLYHAEKGYYPTNLQALVPSYLAQVPAKPDGTAYNYDSATGRLVDGPVAASVITAQDRQSIETIRAAVNKYGMAVGYYPPNLQTLVQYGYLTHLPMTSSGQQFLFNAQNGALTHPAETQQRPTTAAAPQQRGRRSTGMSGGGPLGEVMTGIAIQNDLGNMSNSGASAARGAARRGLGNATSQYNQRQAEALRQINQ